MIDVREGEDGGERTSTYPRTTVLLYAVSPAAAADSFRRPSEGPHCQERTAEPHTVPHSIDAQIRLDLQGGRGALARAPLLPRLRYQRSRRVDGAVALRRLMLRGRRETSSDAQTRLPEKRSEAFLHLTSFRKHLPMFRLPVMPYVCFPSPDSGVKRAGKAPESSKCGTSASISQPVAGVSPACHGPPSGYRLTEIFRGSIVYTPWARCPAHRA